jgi:hypothetical protein
MGLFVRPKLQESLYIKGRLKREKYTVNDICGTRSGDRIFTMAPRSPVKWSNLRRISAAFLRQLYRMEAIVARFDSIIRTVHFRDPGAGNRTCSTACAGFRATGWK